MPRSGAMPGEFAVVLRATGGRLAAKRFRGRGGAVEVVPFDRAGGDWLWSVVGLGGLSDLAALLRKLAADPAACIVGERVREGAGALIERRVLEAEGRPAPALLRRDRQWLAFDCDGWLPPGWPEGRAPSEVELRLALLALRATLPGLEDAECVYRLSSSFGLEERPDKLRVPGYGDGLRCHFWFWFDRPVWPESVKRWLRQVAPRGPGRPVWDAGMLDGARPHYTADPVREGVPDPVGVPRLGMLEGRPAVALASWVDEATERAREAREAAELKARRAAVLSRHREDARTAGDVPRMLRARVRALVDERGGASADGTTAWHCALRALTDARAAQSLGDSGAEEDAVRLLLAAGYNARTVKRARESVKDAAVLEALEKAREAVVPLEQARRSSGRSRPAPALEVSTGVRRVPWAKVWDEPVRAVPAAIPAAVPAGGCEGPLVVVPGPEPGAWVPGRFGERMQAEWHRAAVDLVRPALSDGAGADEWSVFDVGRELAELCGAVGAEMGEPAGDALEAVGWMPAGVLRAAGVVDDAGEVWEPLRSRRALWPVVYPGPAAVPVGLFCLEPGAARPWVGLRWPVARCGYQVGRDPVEPAGRLLVIVPEAADALAFDARALGGGAADPVLDVVAIGDEWRDEWSAWFSRVGAVLLAWSPSARKWRAGDIAARAAARCDVPAVWSEEWPDDGTSSWRQREPAKVLAWWRRKLGEVASDGRHSTK